MAKQIKSTDGKWPNRIREIREARPDRMSQVQLARKAGTTQQTVSMFEKGARQLTVEWMGKFAKALDVGAQELISSAAVASLDDDVEALHGNGLGAIAAIAASKKLRLFKVLKDSVSQARGGVNQGDIIGVDEGAAPATGDIVLVSISHGSEEKRHTKPHLMLFQFVEPGLFLTNRKGFNIVFSFDDPLTNIAVLGVMIPPAAAGHDGSH